MHKLDGTGLQTERYEVRSIGDLRQMFDALERRDDASLWEAARRAPSQASFFHHLRNQVTSTTYQAGTKGRGHEKVQYHCCLVMVPVVLPRLLDDVVDNAKALEPAVKQVRMWVQEWFEHKVEISIFNAIVGYDEVCVWSPSMMREKLDRLAVHKEPTVRVPPNFDFQLPAEAETLGFFVAAIHRPLDWPRLPAEDPHEDSVLTSKIAGAIQICSGAAQPAIATVLAPEFASDAIVSGIMRWVDSIHASHGIRRWDAQPVDKDLVVLQLEVGEEAETTCPIPLRAHQLGLDGIENILARVAALGSGHLHRPQ
jgi:hypothetical protein